MNAEFPSVLSRPTAYSCIHVTQKCNFCNKKMSKAEILCFDKSECQAFIKICETNYSSQNKFLTHSRHRERAISHHMPHLPITTMGP